MNETAFISMVDFMRVAAGASDTVKLYKRFNYIYGIFKELGHHVTLAHDVHGRRIWLHHRFQLEIGEDTIPPIYIEGEEQIEAFDALFETWSEHALELNNPDWEVAKDIMKL